MGLKNAHSLRLLSLICPKTIPFIGMSTKVKKRRFLLEAFSPHQSFATGTGLTLSTDEVLRQKKIQKSNNCQGKENTMKKQFSLIVVLARLLLCAMLMGVWSQTARAELSDDPLPPTKAADCEEESGEWEKIMCGVENIVGFAQKISKVYSGFKGTFDAATFLGRVLGIAHR
jgi:hypothetical protein